MWPARVYKTLIPSGERSDPITGDGVSSHGNFLHVADLVASVVFGFVEGFIGMRDRLLKVVYLFGDIHAYADRQRKFFMVDAEGGSLDGTSDSLGKLRGFLT